MISAALLPFSTAAVNNGLSQNGLRQNGYGLVPFTFFGRRPNSQSANEWALDLVSGPACLRYLHCCSSSPWPRRAKNRPINLGPDLFLIFPEVYPAGIAGS